MGAMPRDKTLRRLERVANLLKSETQYRHRLIGEYENLREQHADRHTMTQKHLEIMESMDRMNELRIERNALQSALGGSQDNEKPG